MNKKLPSAPSIEACLEQLQRKEERDENSKHQYLINLKSQCEIRENALRTAESLIVAYQKQNQALKEENHQLHNHIATLQQKLANYESLSANSKAQEKTLLKYSQKINELLEKNIASEQRIHLLEKEAQRASEAHLVSEGERAKARMKAKQEKQRREFEGHFKNYLRLPHGEQSSFAASVGKEDGTNGEKRVLEWKLKQKDEEVIILLKRLKETEEKLDGVMGKRGRHLTYDSIDGASTKQSKKMNISEFEH